MKQYRIKSTRHCGNLFHYGHFIVDFLIPLIVFIKEKGTQDSFELYLEYVASQHLGEFDSMVHFLFPWIKIHYLETRLFESSKIPLLSWRGYAFGPYPKEAIQWFQKTIIGPRIETKNTYPKVILIERGATKLRNVPFQVAIHDTGKQRRHLNNHSELERFCDSKFSSFENIKLEGMDWEKQISYFWHAKCIIGQHGAGMCNLLFASKNPKVYEISHWGLQTIHQLALAVDATQFTYLPSTIRHIPPSSFEYIEE